MDNKKCNRICVGALIIDRASGKVYCGDKQIKMPHMEYELLSFLINNPDRAYSKAELISEIWGYDGLGQSATLTVHINRLRKKLDCGTNAPSAIETVWGVGYRLSSSSIEDTEKGMQKKSEPLKKEKSN